MHDNSFTEMLARVPTGSHPCCDAEQDNKGLEGNTGKRPNTIFFRLAGASRVGGGSLEKMCFERNSAGYLSKTTSELSASAIQTVEGSGPGVRRHLSNHCPNDVLEPSNLLPSVSVGLLQQPQTLCLSQYPPPQRPQEQQAVQTQVLRV